MSTEHPERTRPTFGQRLGRGLLWLLRFALRLIFIVLLGIALGVGIFYGAAALYNQYIMPVQVHSIQLDQVRARQEQDTSLTAQRLNDLQARVETLTRQGDSNKQTLAGLEVGLADVRTSQEGQAASLAAVRALQTDLNALQADLEAVQAGLAAAQAALESGDDSVAADLEAVRTAQERVGAALGRLQAEQESLGRELDAQQAEIEAWQEKVGAVRQEIADLAAGLEDDLAPAALRRDLILVQAMNLLARARLLLVQSNYGLAQADLQAARELLLANEALLALPGEAGLAAIVARLDEALGNLPAAPVAAADALDGAWQLLAAGLPVRAALPSTLQIAPPVTVTVPLTPTLPLTPTAGSEITPTVTVTPTTTTGS